MNSAQNVPQPETNPRTILQAISARHGFDLDQSNFKKEVPVAIERADLGDLDTEEVEELIALRIDPSTTPPHSSHDASVLESVVESASQVQQLAERLLVKEGELCRGEELFGLRVSEWEAATKIQEKDLETRSQHLSQQASQVSCQQLHLMKLQSDIVKSYDAVRAAIEMLLSNPKSEGDVLAACKALKFELGGRFDYIAHRWAHLSELMKKTRLTQQAGLGEANWLAN